MLYKMTYMKIKTRIGIITWNGEKYVDTERPVMWLAKLCLMANHLKRDNYYKVLEYKIEKVGEKI